jgi:lipopolysaccharide export system permease protein
MRILDRQRYWDFVKAYVICFVTLISLYVVIDAFTNLDEFHKIEPRFGPMIRLMARYYTVRVSLFYDRLCGVITMLAAIFAVTWMQRNNQHLAMLAAGISTQRAIRPVLVAAALVSAAAIVNQEMIIPKVAEELQRTPDDDGKRQIKTYSRRDVNNILINTAYAYRAEQTIEPFEATFPSDRYGVILNVRGRQARYITPEAARLPLRGGWLIRGATVSPADAPLDGAVLARLDPDAIDDAATAGVAHFAAEALLAALPPPRGSDPGLESGTYFLRTNLGFTSVTQSRLWYNFATTRQLLHALNDPTFESERHEIAVALHARNIRPLLSMALLCLSLPLVLGGYGRNTFINLGFSLGTSAIFYVVLFVCQWLGNNRVIAPEMSTWAPLIGFGTVAAARWGGIRT